MSKIIFVLMGLIFVVGCSQQIEKQGTTTPIITGEAAQEAEQSNVIDVEIGDSSFKPETITIKKGTTVRWTQKDSAKHTVTSDDLSFSSELLSKSETWSYTFNEAGTFNYHCAIHPSMKGTVIVE